MPPAISFAHAALGLVFIAAISGGLLFISMYVPGSAVGVPTPIAGCTWASTSYTRNTTGRYIGATIKLEIARCGLQRVIAMSGNGTLSATSDLGVLFAAGAFPVADLPKFHNGDGIHKINGNCWMQLDVTAQIPAYVVLTIASDGSAAITFSNVNDQHVIMAAGKFGPVYDDYADGIDDAFDSTAFRLDCQSSWITASGFTASSLGISSVGKYKYANIKAYLNRTGVVHRPISQFFTGGK